MTVYEIHETYNFQKECTEKVISVRRVVELKSNEKNPLILVCLTGGGKEVHFTPSAFGLRVFTTMALAEEALAKMNKED